MLLLLLLLVVDHDPSSSTTTITITITTTTAPVVSSTPSITASKFLPAPPPLPALYLFDEFKIRHARHLSARAIGVPDAYLPLDEFVDAIMSEVSEISPTSSTSTPSPTIASPVHVKARGGEEDEEVEGEKKAPMNKYASYTEILQRPYHDTTQALSEVSICLTPQVGVVVVVVASVVPQLIAQN